MRVLVRMWAAAALSFSFVETFDDFRRPRPRDDSAVFFGPKALRLKKNRG
jgi:hypothetical protein